MAFGNTIIHIEHFLTFNIRKIRYNESFLFSDNNNKGARFILTPNLYCCFTLHRYLSICRLVSSWYLHHLWCIPCYESFHRYWKMLHPYRQSYEQGTHKEYVLPHHTHHGAAVPHCKAYRKILHHMHQ